MIIEVHRGKDTIFINMDNVLYFCNNEKGGTYFAFVDDDTLSVNDDVSYVLGCLAWHPTAQEKLKN